MKTIFTISILMFYSTVIACDCVGPQSPRSGYLHTEHIIHGNVVSVRPIALWETIHPQFRDSIHILASQDSLFSQLLYSKMIIETEMEVCFDYKDSVKEDRITIYTHISGSSCGYIHFNEGDEFIVYTSAESANLLLTGFVDTQNTFEKENSYWTHSCTRTRYFSFEEHNALEKIIGEREKQYKGIKQFW